jgi:hypothetical protein
MTDIREILRRLQRGEPDRRIARDLDVSRNTVARYRVWAAGHGVLDSGPLPDAATLAGLLERPPADQIRRAPVVEEKDSLPEPPQRRRPELARSRFSLDDVVGKPGAHVMEREV